MVPWKITFLYEQVVFHFHVSESESISCTLRLAIESTWPWSGVSLHKVGLKNSLLPARPMKSSRGSFPSFLWPRGSQNDDAANSKRDLKQILHPLDLPLLHWNFDFGALGIH